MDKKEFDQIYYEKTFSVARMQPYYDKYPGYPDRAEIHYQQNIQLSESLLPSLSVLEVSLRNVLIRELERMTGSRDWYLTFQTIPELKNLHVHVQTASMRIKARGETVTCDKINGELTLGFWVSLFNSEYERILWKALRNSFSYLPKANKKRKTVSAPLNSIRLLRNRVFHHEAIAWNLSKVEELHEHIIRILEWIDPFLPHWMKKIDRFDLVIRRIQAERMIW